MEKQQRGDVQLSPVSTRQSREMQSLIFGMRTAAFGLVFTSGCWLEGTPISFR